ncbi:MAG: PP2C family protein-serine/threonine phosphatase [Acidimicrobiales bacterium]
MRPLSAAVAALGLALTGALTWATVALNQDSNQRLLHLEVRQAASALEAGLTSLQSQLADALEVETNTGNTAAFIHFASQQLRRGGAFDCVSLWQMTASGTKMLAVAGPTPQLVADGRQSSFFSHLQPQPALAVTGILAGSPPRLGYAEMPPGEHEYVVYAESVLPATHHLVVPSSSPFHDLNFALYLGRDQNKHRLIEASLATPVTGPHAEATAPFGDTVMTVVGKPLAPLTGNLTRVLPWVVLGAGTALSLTGGVTSEYILRRRRLAEALAAENERLYLEQRDIAGTLQQALLPQLHGFGRLEVAARYIPGVAGIDVGGDWYDVIANQGDHYVFVVGDVSGRGLPAATTMASLRYSTRAYVAQGDEPGAVLARLARLLDFETDNQFATVLIGELDLPAQQLRLASAGHYPALLISAGGARYLRPETAAPIGVDEASHPTTATFELPVAGTLVAFTDGLVERRGEPLDVSLERLRTVAQRHPGHPDRLLNRLVSQLAANGAQDDVAVLAMRWGA